MNPTLCVLWLAILGARVAAQPAGAAEPEADDQIQAVIDEVEKACLERRIPMVGRKKAQRLAELVREKKPKLVVECGTAIGYSGLWIARQLKRGGGKLITIEIDVARAKEAEGYFRKAGLDEIVTVKIGDARQMVKHIEGPIDFALLDCGYSNYFECLKGMQPRLAPGAIIVADNVGIGESGMKDYLDEVRSKYDSKTEWFDVDLPWVKRDAMEITVVTK